MSSSSAKERDHEHGHFSTGQEQTPEHAPDKERHGHFSEGQEARHVEESHGHFSTGREKEDEHAAWREHRGRFSEGQAKSSRRSHLSTVEGPGSVSGRALTAFLARYRDGG
jgi:hypothetical protein